MNWLAKTVLWFSFLVVVSAICIATVVHPPFDVSPWAKLAIGIPLAVTGFVTGVFAVVVVIGGPELFD